MILRQLEVKRQGEYVSPRVIQGIFNYLGKAYVFYVFDYAVYYNHA